MPINNTDNTAVTISRLLLRCRLGLILTLAISFTLSSQAAQLPCYLPDATELQGNISLQPHCIYRQSLLISHSNTHLDCQGATLEGDNHLPFGIMVNSKGSPLKNISIKNCHIRNFSRSGIRITSNIPANQLSTDHQINYHRTPTAILIDAVVVTGSGRVGIYFDDYVTDSTLSNSTVQQSYMSGIYLEHSSRYNRIINNRIVNNGHESFGRGKREGLAVDSSANNLIEGNLFEGNGAGGVFLYKNCGEHYSSGKSVIRWQHSDNNIIRNNTFTHEQVGIWLASRQSRDLSGFDCGDKAKDNSGQYFADYANNNVLEGNKFIGTQVDIKDEGVGNREMN